MACLISLLGLELLKELERLLLGSEAAHCVWCVTVGSVVKCAGGVG